jgi:hypothetical protein
MYHRIRTISEAILAPTLVQQSLHMITVFTRLKYTEFVLGIESLK